MAQGGAQAPLVRMHSENRRREGAERRRNAVSTSAEALRNTDNHPCSSRTSRLHERPCRNRGHVPAKSRTAHTHAHRLNERRREHESKGKEAAAQSLRALGAAADAPKCGPPRRWRSSSLHSALPFSSQQPLQRRTCAARAGCRSAAEKRHAVKHSSEPSERAAGAHSSCQGASLLT